MKLEKLVGERFKEKPSDCTVESHALMVRGGYMKYVANGIFSSYMPLKRITRKIEQILREEMDAIDGQEVQFPVVMPASLWQESGRYESIGECIRTSFFQVTAIISTAGFATANFDLWPAFSQTILLFLMFIGACAGSTTGALKLSRVMLIFKGTMREIRHVLRPRSVNIVRMDGVAVPEEIVRSAIGYLALHTMMLIGTVFLISFDGYSFETNFTAALACLNNIGPGLKEVGPVGNFAGFSLISQFLLAFIMILGRLEIIPMLVLLSPDTWKSIFGQKESAKIRKLQRIPRLPSARRPRKHIKKEK